MHSCAVDILGNNSFYKKVNQDFFLSSSSLFAFILDIKSFVYTS